MKITQKALKSLIKESVGNRRILSERPWTVEFLFRLSGGIASDSEGEGPDGFSILLKGERGEEVTVSVDSYWNPQVGDKSGNSIKIQTSKKDSFESYVPHRFDDGENQVLVISNSPTTGTIIVSHSPKKSIVPVVYLAVKNPFSTNEDVSFHVKNLGNGTSKVKISRYFST